MRLLWFVLPDEFLILVIAVIAIGLMLRLITGRAAAGIIGGLLLCVLAEPFIEALTTHFQTEKLRIEGERADDTNGAAARK